MSGVYIVSAHCLPITRGEGAEQRDMARRALMGALEPLQGVKPQAVFVGNMLSAQLHNQQQLGALLAGDVGLQGVEAMTIETACSSGAAALRVAAMALAGGSHDLVAVVGVEAMTSHTTPEVTRGLAMASDWQLEGSRGETFVSLNASLMRAYIERYDVSDDAFAPFSILAHKNAMTAPHSGLKRAFDLEAYKSSKVIDDPLRLLDASLICDGAAAVILANDRGLKLLAGGPAGASPRVRLEAIECGTDAVGLENRDSLLALEAIRLSTERALSRSGRTREEIDIFELHDAYTIMAAASLEAAGFVDPGGATVAAAAGEFELTGRLPIATFGGLKARGHAIGATGVYQVVEMWTQLRGEAGANQVIGARCAMAQSIGGAGSTVFTSILSRE